MNNKNLIKTIFATAVISFSLVTGAMAQSDKNEPQTIDCNYKEGYLDQLKTNQTKLQEQAIDIGQEICLTALKVLPSESIEINDRLTNFASEAKYEFDQIFPEAKFIGASELSQSWYNLATRPTNDYRNWALIEGTRLQGGMPPRINGIKLELYVDPNSKKSYTFNQAQKDQCAKVIDDSSIPAPDGVKDCKNALDLWGNAVSPFQYFYTNRVLVDNGQKISKLQSQWKTFIDESRYQTPLDVWVTTAWYSDQFKSHHLTGPPSTQLFLLHPTIVYEHLPDADKGSKEDISLAIEWGGINWWQSGFGFSITSVYKDRKDQPSVGTGVTFHIKNKYSFGYAYRDNGDDSIFFNIDILEWFGDKEEKYKKYKAYFE